MDDIINVNTKELKKTTKRIDRGLADINTNVQKLYSECLYKVGDAWKSRENYDYLNNLTDYIADLKQLVNSINTFNAVLKTVATEYDKTAEKSRSVAVSALNE